VATAEVDILQTVHFQGIMKVEGVEVTEVVHRSLTEEVGINCNMCLQVRYLKSTFV
jgi:hypothetical protein